MTTSTCMLGLRALPIVSVEVREKGSGCCCCSVAVAVAVAVVAAVAVANADVVVAAAGALVATVVIEVAAVAAEKAAGKLVLHTPRQEERPHAWSHILVGPSPKPLQPTTVRTGAVVSGRQGRAL